MIKVSIVGVGGIGKTHIRNLLEIPFVQITDICDLNPQSAALAESLGAQYYSDLEVLLQSSTSDVVIICTPTFMHFSQVSAVLRANKHCISEKPLCLTCKDAEALFALAQANQVYLMVAQVMRFWDEYELLAQLIAAEKYGKVVDAYFHRLTEAPKWTTGNWLFDASKSGLQPFDLHIHELDFIVSVFGEPKSFVVQSGCGDKTKGIPDYYRINYSFDHLTVCAESAWYNAAIPFTQGFRVYFEKAVVIFDGNQLMLYTQEQEPETLLCANQENAIHTGINVSATTAYLKEMQYFLSCIQAHSAPNRVPKEQILSVLKILEKF